MSARRVHKGVLDRSRLIRGAARKTTTWPSYFSQPPAAALVVPAVVDAGRTEARPYRQRRYRVTGFVPGGLHGRRPGRPEAGKAAAVVALPDPCVVHDGLVVVADDPAQLGLDPGQGTSLRRLHLVSHPTRKPGLGVRGVGYHAGTLRAHPRTRRAGAASSRAAARPPGGFPRPVRGRSPENRHQRIAGARWPAARPRRSSINDTSK